MIIIIDNYDSFTYNIVQTIHRIRANDPVDLRVFRNDEISLAELDVLSPERLLISPGPCDPFQAGISIAAIRHFTGRIPILGVCLGHQAIGAAFGGKVVRAGRLMHGKTSPITHDGRGVFTGLSSPFDAMRYHSLLVSEEHLPDCLEITARTDIRELMAVRHRQYPIEGVQFHPESIMTPDGVRLLANFIDSRYRQMVGR